MSTETTSTAREVAAEISKAIGQPAQVEKSNDVVLQNEPAPPKPAPKALPYITFSSSKDLKNLLSALAVLVDEATFTAGLDGLRLRGMDPSRVAMLDLFLPKETFEEYAVESEVKLCINLTYVKDHVLKNIYGNGGGAERCKWTIDTQLQKLRVNLVQRLDREFKVPLLEASDEEAPLPKIPFTFGAKLMLNGLADVLKEDASDHVRISGSQDNVLFEEPGDLTDFKCKMQKGSDTLLDIEYREDTHATYSTSYLGEWVPKLKPLCDLVTLRFATDMPMQLSAAMPHGETLDFWLAPRIETD